MSRQLLCPASGEVTSRLLGKGRGNYDLKCHTSAVEWKNWITNIRERLVINLLASVAVAALLVACGGGGSDNLAPMPLAATPPAVTPPVVTPPVVTPPVVTPPVVAPPVVAPPVVSPPVVVTPPAPPTSTTVNVTGKITFDYVPVAVTANVPRLDYANIAVRPARSISVALMNSNTGAELATAKTDASGNYSLVGPIGQSVFVRAYARLLPVNTSTTATVAVLDNTSGDAQWVLDGAAFTAASAVDITKNLNASSGWTGAAYNNSLRIGATFAILDTIYSAMQKILAVDSTAAFPTLNVHWSPNNIAATGGSIATGQIGTSFFQSTQVGSAITARDLYILGRSDNDTDEYDQHVVTHEFGHYLQSAFSRSDSIGGSHGGTNDRLDMRVAFSEGWGNGWAAYALSNRIYADTSGPGQVNGFTLDVSLGEANNPGWFKESSVQKIIWDLSTGTIGFGPVWTAMKTGFSQSAALASAHAFANALRVNLPSSLATLNSIFNNQQITVPTDAFGAGETNFGLPAIPQINPIYIAYGALGSVSNVCVTNAADPGLVGNKAGQHRYIKLALPAGSRVINVTRDAVTAAATDPDFSLYSSAGIVIRAAAGTPNTETGTTTVSSAGDYVLAVTDYNFRTSATLRTTCFNVTVN